MTSRIRFDRFSLDEEGLSLDGKPVDLRPKSLAVLRLLARRRGEVITKDELFETVWPDTAVGDVVLKVCVRELRKALGDSARSPRFIETLHRRGYRFIGEVQRPATPALFGREEHLAAAERALDRAIEGTRQTLFIHGEAGVGKTTLIEAILEEAEGRPRDRPWIARGQCMPVAGDPEPFSAILEGLARLAREPDAAELPELLRRHAPSWLLQLPGLLDDPSRAQLARECLGSGRGRMLRELTVGLESITETCPLILVVEDLHWCDAGTIELLQSLARGRAPARLLVLATSRTGDADESPERGAFIDELERADGHQNIALGRLDEAALRACVTTRLAPRPVDESLIERLRDRTDGHPLFLSRVLDDLVAHWDEGAAAPTLDLAPGDVPESLRRLILAQLDRLGPSERATLEAASLDGQEFTAPTVAAALDEPLEDTEVRLSALARRGKLVRWVGERRWPDGTAAAEYEFEHILFSDALRGSLPPTREAALHRKMGTRLEAGWEADPIPVAHRLAIHFDRGGDAAKAIRHLASAGALATQRHAYATAIEHYTRALELLEPLGDGHGRAERELPLLVGLGVPLLNALGFGAPRVEETFSRALEICRRVGESPDLFSVLAGLQAFYAVGGDLHRAFELSQQMRALAQRIGDRAMELDAHHALGCDLQRLGRFEESRKHLERAIRLYRPEDKETAYRFTGHDPRTCCLGMLSQGLFHQGRPDEGLRRAYECTRWGEEVGMPFSLTQGPMSAALVHLMRGEGAQAEHQAGRALAMAADHDLPFWYAWVRMTQGWAAALQGRHTEAWARLAEGRDVCRLMGPRVGEAEWIGIHSRIAAIPGMPLEEPPERVIEIVTEGIARAEELGEGYLEADLYSNRGDLRVRGAPGGRPSQRTMDAAEEDYRAALAVARERKAAGQELRAAKRLARLWLRSRRHREARAVLEPARAKIEGGESTPYVQAADALLAEARQQD